MVELKLKNHSYCNCYVEMDNIENPTQISFISYRTLVIYATKEDDVWNIQCTGTYSQTTRKQIGYFLKEYFPLLNYYNIKEIAGKEKIIVYNSNIEKFYIKNDIAK